MFLQPHDKVARKRENSFQTFRRLKRWQGEKEISQSIAPREYAVHNSAIKAVTPLPLARSERKISSNDRSSSKEVTKKYVRTEMHVVMTINASWIRVIKPIEFV